MSRVTDELPTALQIVGDPEAPACADGTCQLPDASED